MLVRNGVSVLLYESFDLVGHIKGVVGDRESGLAKPRLFEYCFGLWFGELGI